MNDNVWAILLLVRLMVYSGTLNYFCVVLLYIAFHFFNRNPSVLNLISTMPIIGLLYYLNSVSVFACICLLSIIVIFKSLFQLKQSNLYIEHSYAK